MGPTVLLQLLMLVRHYVFCENSVRGKWSGEKGIGGISGTGTVAVALIAALEICANIATV